METNSICDSSSTNKINPETLDNLYKEQLKDLRTLILNNIDPNLLGVCEKWIQIFNRVSLPEKMARNCLCTLMQHQIKEDGTLGQTFLKLENLNRNLEYVLQEVDKEQTDYGNNTVHSNPTTQPKWQCEEAKEYLNFDNNTNELNEIIQLRHNITDLKFQIINKENENNQLKQIAIRKEDEKKSFEELMAGVMQRILENIHQQLSQLQQYGFRSKLKLFECIFQENAIEKDFLDAVKSYDKDFQCILRKYFELEFDKRKMAIVSKMQQKFNKTHKKMQQNYEKQIQMQNLCHKLQMKFVKLECFSVLRQIFLNCDDKFGQIDKWQVLKTLEDKYHSTMDDI